MEQHSHLILCKRAGNSWWLHLDCGKCFILFLAFLWLSRFKPAVVKECIRETVKARLSEVQYDPDEVSELTRTLADSVKNKVKSEWCKSVTQTHKIAFS